MKPLKRYVLIFIIIFLRYNNTVCAQYGYGGERSIESKTFFSEFRYSIHDNIKTRMYYDFLKNVDTKSSFDDHLEIGFVLHQQKVFGRNIHLHEYLYMVSQIGMGAQVGIDAPIHTNRIISISPSARFSLCNLATGLREFTMLQSSIEAGLIFTLMPSANMSFLINYYPLYNVRYGSTDDKLMTFQGRGWSYGFRLTLPEGVVRPINLGLLYIDLSRTPITYTIESVSDSYTDKKLKIKKLTLSFLLN